LVLLRSEKLRMNKKGIGWVILAIIVIVIVILGILAIVAFSRMKESAVNLDFSSALANYGIFLIVGVIIIITVVVVALLLMRR
jgi:uncharacterized membrane protein YidH (DUF202 family)